MTTTSSRLACQPRYATVRTPERDTLGPRVGELAERLGKPLMPWQQYVADVVMEIDPLTGGLAYQEFGLTVPRQSGKSILLLAKALFRGSATARFGRDQTIVYTAQTRKDARKKFEKDYAGVINGSRYMKARADCRWGNGNEHIRLPNGSRFELEAPTEKAGHGSTIDEAYIDEAFAQVDYRLEQAFRPAMITRSNKQLGWISTAGWRDASPYLEAKVKRGRDAAEMGLRDGLAYFEWSAPDDADPHDRDVWRACMPALGHTISEQAIAAELDSMGLPDFRRAYLNQWVPKPSDDDCPIDGAVWAGLSALIPRPANPVFYLDCEPDSSAAWVGVAAMVDGQPHVELADDPRRGVDWLPMRAAELRDRYPAARFAVLGSGAASTLLPDLRALGVEPVAFTSQDMGRACVHFAKLVADRAVSHSGDEAFSQALSVAVRRDIGDDLWTWSRRKSGTIGPLVAVTGAAWLLASQPSYDVLTSVW